MTLTTAIASGDTEAFAAFYREWFDTMFAQAVRACKRDEAFCLDVVQDAMMRIIRSMRPMETADDLRRWLRAVIQSCAYDKLRSESRRRAREQKRADDQIRSGGGSAPAHDRDEITEQLAWLDGELRNLDDEATRLVVLRHRFGWTLQQIGDAVGLAPGAVDGRIRRLLSRLRRRAKEHFDD